MKINHVLSIVRVVLVAACLISFASDSYASSSKKRKKVKNYRDIPISVTINSDSQVECPSEIQTIGDSFSNGTLSIINNQIKVAIEGLPTFTGTLGRESTTLRATERAGKRLVSYRITSDLTRESRIYSIREKISNSGTIQFLVERTTWEGVDFVCKENPFIDLLFPNWMQ